MKWIKRGLICRHDSFDIPWFKRNAMVPVPHLIAPDRLRLYITMCDEQCVGRIGYLDLNPKNPLEILDYSRTPLVDVGTAGTFDDNGVVTSAILRDENRLLLYYSGYQLCVKVPYLIFSGVAESYDNGHSFTKISKQVPMLERLQGEVSSRCAPFVLKEGSGYRMWYTADSKSGWIEGGHKRLPLYDLKYTSSSSPVDWPSKSGETVITFQNEDEHGIAKSTVWIEDGIYKVLYSIRSLSKGYRLGYAESVDGVHFIRKDAQVGIDVSESGWDSEMIAFPERFRWNDKVYLFYCGNQYGLGGIGYAEMDEG